MAVTRRVIASLLAGSLLWTPAAPAEACACCPSEGEYASGALALDAYEVGELAKVRFGPTLKLSTGEQDEADVGAGLKHPAAAYPVSGSVKGRVLTLMFRDAGKAVPVSLTLPAQYGSFRADIHDGKTFSGGGPLLYKEWRLEGAVKDGGLFQPGRAPTRYRLVLQGRGGNCDEAAQFTHWHLRLSAPRADYDFHGALGK